MLGPGQGKSADPAAILGPKLALGKFMLDAMRLFPFYLVSNQ